MSEIDYRLWMLPAYNGQDDSTATGRTIVEAIEALIEWPMVLLVEHQRVHGDERPSWNSDQVREILSDISWFGEGPDRRGFVLQIKAVGLDELVIKQAICQAISREVLLRCHARGQNVTLHIQ